MSTAANSNSTKRTNYSNLESSINNNLGDFEIKLDISNDTSEIIKINLNNDFLSAINDVCDKYEINEFDRQIIIKNTIDDIEKIINSNETLIYPNSSNNNNINDENNNDNNNILINNSKFSYNTPKKNDMKIISFKKQKISTSKSKNEFNQKNNLNVIKENSPKKRNHKNIDQYKLGENMYEKAMKKIKIQKIKNENIKKDLTENYSFFPETNKNKNKKLLESKSLEKLKFDKRLILKGLKTRKNKINKFIEKSYVKDIKEITDENENFYSFTPKLNKNKNKILLKNYNFEYKNKKIKEKNKNFHPKIYKKNTNQNFNKTNLISNLIKNNKENEEIIIYKKRLSKSLKKLEIKNKIIEKDSSIIENYNKRKLLFKNYSNNLINETKILKYKKIFDKLDENKDGLISYDNLNVKEIEKEDLIEISSLIYEITSKKLTNLNFEKFKLLAQKNK